MTSPSDLEGGRHPDGAPRARGVLADYALEGPAPTTEDFDAGIAREVGRLDAQSKGEGDDDLVSGDE
ncbi:hypothetical protein [Rubrivirga litoralis]|uniref:Uncharacterized protein n=1 Tax=Rubrivirga litoralis TaxID=3075598 RepID=A0ABU3BQ63_9BACT|nr:hypothetical protein [Rubrivirga sp. F394]MDT0631425.1 hypothetical protein [Rubrivirga sp. F394]